MAKDGRKMWVSFKQPQLQTFSGVIRFIFNRHEAGEAQIEADSEGTGHLHPAVVDVEPLHGHKDRAEQEDEHTQYHTVPVVFLT